MEQHSKQLELFKGRVKNVSDKVELFHMLCETTMSVAMMLSGEELQSNLIGSQCDLRRVIVSDKERQIYEPFSGLSAEVPFYFQFNRNSTSPRYVKRINVMILALFNTEKITTYWLFKELPSLKNYYVGENTSPPSFHPMNLERLAIIFLIYLGLCCLSLVVFGFEITYHKKNFDYFEKIKNYARGKFLANIN
ncbi:hypothetical protein PRIPAC_91250 [Pristionchus pacificus]|uniref:Uncharacterized protein n=1 Tax=Pristionchus pacificus TaxID=54126 RepID=A0A2A6B3Y8_PRIPA|nr:hypothetical protein PRIPAC_91250 [Pristionchus pacificus]|eukprot:PDM60573.1 hypothetical protein PRIPAC_53551 [Pristionchus pacificus]